MANNKIKDKDIVESSRKFFNQLWVKIIRWLFGIIFIGSSIATYETSIPGSIIYLALGILCIPPLWNIFRPQLSQLWKIIKSLPFSSIAKPITKPLSGISPNLIFIGAIVLASTIIWSTAFSKKEIKTFKNSVSVTGVATKNVTSDKALWRIGISRKSLDRSKNLQLLKSDEQDVREYIAGLGFEKNEISESQFNVATVYKEKESGYGTTNVIENYTSTVSIFVSTNKVYKVGEGVNKLRLFVEGKGIDLSENRAEYTYSAFETEKIPLLEKAVADAQLRANALVSSTTGVSKTAIGKVLSAQQGIFQINSANDSSVSDYGNFDLSSIEKTIRATVKVEFATE